MDVSNLRMVADRILVLRDPADKMAGSLHLPKEKTTHTGQVVKVGPGKRDKEGRIHRMDVKPGDRVMFGFLDGEDLGAHVILTEDEVKVVLGGN